MSTHLVSYDLRTPGKDYSVLHEHLKSYRRWRKPLESVWFVKSALSAKELRDAIRSKIDENDKLIVIEVSGDVAAWYGLPDATTTWLKENL